MRQSYTLESLYIEGIGQVWAVHDSYMLRPFGIRFLRGLGLAVGVQCLAIM